MTDETAMTDIDGTGELENESRLHLPSGAEFSGEASPPRSGNDQRGPSDDQGQDGQDGQDEQSSSRLSTDEHLLRLGGNLDEMPEMPDPWYGLDCLTFSSVNLKLSFLGALYKTPHLVQKWLVIVLLAHCPCESHKFNLSCHLNGHN